MGINLIMKKRISSFLHYFVRKKIIYLVLLGIFFLLIVINNLDWLRRDNRVPICDQDIHITNSYIFFHRQANGNINNFFIERISNYPPLVYQVSSLFYFWFSPSPDMAVMSQIPFWAILMFSIYFIGKHLWCEEVGFLAAVASFSFPYMLMMSQSYLLDLPSAALVALSILFLLYCDVFRKPFWTIAFFISMALAILGKWSSVFYILPVFLLCFAIFIRDAFKKNKSPWLTLIILISIIAISFWRVKWINDVFNSQFHAYNSLTDIYWESVSPLIILLIITFFIPFKAKSSKNFIQGVLLFIILTWHSYGLKFFDYLNYFYSTFEFAVLEGDSYFSGIFLNWFIQVQWLPWLVFLAIGLMWYLFTRDKNRDRTIFVVGYLGAIAILFSIQDREPRYFIPTIAFSSVIMTFWIFQIKWKPVRIILASLLMILAIPGITGWRIKPLCDFVKRNEIINEYYYEIMDPFPRTTDLKIDETIRILEEKVDHGPKVILIVTEGEAEAKFPLSFLAMALNRNRERCVKFLKSINGMGADGFIPSRHTRFDFFLASNEDVEKNLYNNLIVLYYEDKSRKGEDKANFKKILEKRGFCGELKEEKVIEISDNIILHIFSQKIVPPTVR